MLAYFPYLYENELIYSVFARYYNHTGNPSKKLNIRRKELIPGKSWTISPAFTDLFKQPSEAATYIFISLCR
ncbi:hypothetical protein ACT7CZ_26855 [Bacillus cereus]